MEIWRGRSIITILSGSRRKAERKLSIWQASVFLFLLASVVSFAFRGNGGIFLGAAGLFSFLLSGYGFYVGMKSFKEEQVSHRMSVLGSITSGGMLVAWLALFLIGVR